MINRYILSVLAITTCSLAGIFPTDRSSAQHMDEGTRCKLIADEQESWDAGS